ncbi:primosomal protein N' (replication factor Y) (superfamily II helicase) [Parelusimicrobium proximum]|uniref:replication restart helicase PriA n=1 Tax=Parelusimicrobium proximum TaxID=3228953 RepID=UPI003D182827
MIKLYASVAFDIALDKTFDYIIPEHLAGQVRTGIRVRAPFGPREAVGIVTDIHDSADTKFKLKEIKKIIDQSPMFGRDLVPLARYIKANYSGTQGQILFSLIPSFYSLTDTAPKQIKNTFTEEEKAEITKFTEQNPVSLIKGEGHAGKKTTALKYAAYFSLSGQSLILAPDVISAENLAKRFETEYGVRPYIWHSKVLASKKREHISALLKSENCVTVGTRSAALLPFTNLKFTAVTDEEDSDYKQEENKPYFHARDIMLFRSKAFGSSIMFASRTPSLELWKMAREGYVKVFDRPAASGHFIRVSVTPKGGEKAKTISDILLSDITSALSQNKNSLLILNRKSAAETYACLNCGLLVTCSKCSTPMVLNEAELMCPKCMHKSTLEQKCPKCSNVIFQPKATALTKVISELKKTIKGVNIIKIDSAALAKDAELMRYAREAKGSVIIGTNIALKALENKNDIQTIAVLDADMELNSPNFRSSEEMMQMLFAARSVLQTSKDSSLVIQTDKQDAAIFNAAVHGDYAAFAKDELEFREAFAFPPYVDVIKITLAAKDIKDVDTVAEMIKNEARALANTETTDPVKCGKKTDKLKKKYLLMKTVSRERAVKFLESLNLPKTVKMQIITDPYSFF